MSTFERLWAARREREQIEALRRFEALPPVVSICLSDEDRRALAVPMGAIVGRGP